MADDNEAQAVTGRPNDIPVRDPEPAPLGGNSSFAERAKARAKNRNAKSVESADVEDKSVARSERKSTKGRR